MGYQGGDARSLGQQTTQWIPSSARDRLPAVDFRAHTAVSAVSWLVERHPVAPLFEALFCFIEVLQADLHERFTEVGE